MKLEIAKNGPIVCGIDANPVHDGTHDPKHIFEDAGSEVDHDISVVGWAEDPKLGNYWIVRNSWGSTWGDSGFF